MKFFQSEIYHTCNIVGISARGVFCKVLLKHIVTKIEKLIRKQLEKNACVFILAACSNNHDTEEEIVLEDGKEELAEEKQEKSETELSSVFEEEDCINLDKQYSVAITDRILSMIALIVKGIFCQDGVIALDSKEGIGTTFLIK